MYKVIIEANVALNASIWRRAMAYACDFMAEHPNRPPGENIAIDKAFMPGRTNKLRGTFYAWYTPARVVRVRGVVDP